MMPSTTSARMIWLIILALAWRAEAQVPLGYSYLAARQDLNPVLDFTGIQQLNATSCAPISFTWIYVGPDIPVSINITNIVESQDSPTSILPLPTVSHSSGNNARSLYRRDDIDIQIVSSISSTADALKLMALPVPQGIYHLVATGNSTTIAKSSPFTVQEGTNTSCLSSSPISSSMTTSTSTLSSSATSSDPASITSSDVSSASTSPTVVPVGEISGTQVNKSAIAGGVTAGVVVLIAAGVLYFCVTHSKRSGAHSRTPGAPHSHASSKGGFVIGSSGGADGGGRWGGLASVDSHVPLGNSKTQRPYANTARQENGAGASRDDINSYLSRSGSLKDGGYAGSPSEEKFASSPSEEMTLSTLPYDPNLYAPNNNARSYSMASTNLPENRHSQSHAWRTSLESSSIHAYSPFLNPPALSPTSLTHSAVTAPKPPRKTARKPVPAYDDSSAFSTPGSSSMSSSPVHATTPFADPVITYPAPVSSGHYSTRAERESVKSSSSKKTSKSKMHDKDKDKDKSDLSSATTSRDELNSQELAHKNSFGPGGLEGKQLHYLIPDMPIGYR